jgi:hypothetical protein
MAERRRINAAAIFLALVGFNSILAHSNCLLMGFGAIYSRGYQAVTPSLENADRTKPNLQATAGHSVITIIENDCNQTATC